MVKRKNLPFKAMAGIYLHIPFCHNKCSYCDFYSTPDHNQRKEYVKSLIKELQLWLKTPEVSEIEWNTVYIGGGTPSMLTLEELTRIVSFLPLEHVEEFTIEANPEDITEEWVSNVQSLGINRISIGIQSFDDKELELVRRNHKSEEAIGALKILKQSGIGNISADLIYGLPGQTIRSWEKSLDTLVGFNPEHISAYSLSYEPGTRLYAMLKAGKIKEASDETICQMYNMLTSKMTTAGYDHYEISNFGTKGKHSKHNSSYWTFSPYLGIGAAAHGYIKGIRYANPWSISKYIQGISSGIFVSEKEVLTLEDIYNEYLMTSLRTSTGLQINRMAELTDTAHADRLQGSLLKPLNRGLLEETTVGIRIPESKWLISDSIIRDIMI